MTKLTVIGPPPPRPRSLAPAVFLLALACASSPRRPTFHPDDRYQRTIPFEALGTTIPITREGSYVRFDGLVPDLDAHQATVLREFGIPSSAVRYTNPATAARTTTIEFAGGQRCAVVWVKQHENRLVSEGRTAHEKFHVLARLAPERLDQLEQAMARKGLPVRLGTFDEESAASVVEVATIHLLGAPLEDIHGSELIEKARRVLLEARRAKRARTAAVAP
jgi:hypothetical protein